MKRHIWWISLIIATILMAACIVIIVIAWNMQPGSSGVLAMALTGMFSGVIASVFGAISWSTYMPPWERAEHRAASAVRHSQRLK